MYERRSRQVGDSSDAVAGGGRGPIHRRARLLRGAVVIVATGALSLILGLVGVAYGIYAIVRGGRDQEGGGLGPIPERAVHAVAGVRMLIGGAVAIFLGIVAIVAALSG